MRCGVGLIIEKNISGVSRRFPPPLASKKRVLWQRPQAWRVEMSDLRERLWRKTEFAYAPSPYATTSFKSYVLVQERASEAVQFEWTFTASTSVRFHIEFRGTGYDANEYDRLYAVDNVEPRREYSGVVSFHCCLLYTSPSPRDS